MAHEIELDGHSLITPDAISAEVSSSIAVGEGVSAKLNAETLDETRTAIVAELDNAKAEFEQGLPPADIGLRVTILLHETRAKLDVDTWRSLIPIIQAHPVSEFFLQDPLTRWSWDKPRGYSGDAHLLDLIYRHEKTAPQIADASPLGRELFEFTSRAPSSQANWDRRDILARHVDEAAARKGQGAEVLSFAAGHLREADCSEALKAGILSRWVAVDQDPLSIAEIEESFEGTCVEAVNGSARELIGKRLQLGTFDHVYASGIYDYLNDKVAIKVTQRLLEMVKPGGSFLFANYSYPIVVDGYLETFMNWTLLLRSEEDMWRIINESADPSEWSSSVFFGHERNIAYGVMRRKG